VPLPSTSRVVAPGPTGAGSLAWAHLVDEASACTKCPLHANRTHAVIYRGGDHPRVLFVGEAPGAEEDRLGLPFVGRSGRRLDEAIVQLGLGPSEFGIVNLLKCRPPQNRFDAAAAKVCRPYLDRQLGLLAPERLVTLGAHALRSLDPDAPKVTEAAGTPRVTPRGPVFPLLHPAAALHAPAFRARWYADLTALAVWLRAPLSETS
jgi:uracil-DNA glycosylase family 4